MMELSCGPPKVNKPIPPVLGRWPSSIRRPLPPYFIHPVLWYTGYDNVHVLLLDASKAFDRVNYVKLFNKMLSKGMCPLTVRLLLNMYTQQKLQVKWDNLLTQQFMVTNGVRQGGVLSPLFFSLYIDDLLEKLKINGIGCHIGNHFVGALRYADDIILLSPAATGLREMITICEEYANEHSILFNGKKSKYLAMG